MTTSIHAGSCFCGAVSYTVTGKPTLSAYCHCTRCQVPAHFTASATGSALIWTIHYPTAAFAWTQSEPHDAHLDSYVTGGKPWKTRYRCKTCGSCVASHNTKVGSWSVWGTQFERDENGETKDLEGVRPTAHIFYDTAIVNVDDGLGKWDGYEGKSTRLGN
ncbi:Mss4-like protein [Mycena pura]|uniref:Mss4-like protein n=1 Tax=Mycena pura TaxID=153505 RepID=A0AAD6VAV3_9AGAR|nr:Mss4-like protein [Mycena pura]